MIYSFDIEKIPKIEHIYIVTRKTVWQVADQYNIIMIILDGTCKIEVNNEVLKLNTGDSIFIPKGETYRRSPIGDTLATMLYVHFSVTGDISELSSCEARGALEALKLDVRSSLLPEKQFFPSHTTNIFIPSFFPSGDGHVLSLSREIANLLPVFKATDALFISLKFCEILSFINKKTVKELTLIEADVGVSAVPQKLKRAVFYIRENESRKITLDALCKVSSVSESQLIRYFKSSFGKTPNEYIREYKINRAREMFQSAPELTIKEVCDLLGFDDSHYFSRVFKATTGESPSDYKYRVTHFISAPSDK